MTRYTTWASPLGELLLAGTAAESGIALTGLALPGGPAVRIEPDWVSDASAFAPVVARLAAYFAGERIEFGSEFAVPGTEFQRQVWHELDRIPYGTTTGYREIAARIGRPTAARAVGAAVGANPLLIVRPCHRVVGAGGQLTGYAGGLAAKRRLLELEGAR
ncbi:methylated-DNA--[protein]-cysteine S-methyltransferase [Nocardia stercoris]|uniref:Methylated-DNA--protein-cysteine methyltransferase n=1 Tax=Nocardia stercoris TaxID=2483361 RepID=A0A3M2L7N8_9NOCA|nr:methylated-DNA--[protein]-cysteine S-methyltransferase [Nocardia stercoris]RMI32573.1 methylated-DNA--[protein]-cysteine S-methyltransferase [Nocardia stercoris]